MTHIDNLPSIVAAGGLVPETVMMAQGNPQTAIGMSTVKQRRLTLPVNCHPGDFVGGYVPFYFCSRSVMLFIVYRGNHPELTYRGGQEPIVHLEADLHETIDWAEQNGRRWAFSRSNAGACYVEFCNERARLDEINWPAVAAANFRPAEIKEGKQAEFLLHGSFPWQLVRRIGVQSRAIAQRTRTALDLAVHRPIVEISTDWYF